MELALPVQAWNRRPAGSHVPQGQSEVYRRPMNILLIDDDLQLRKSLRLALETMKHQVVEAANGAEAKALVQQSAFHVAFLDLRLGKEHGLDLLPELLRLAPEVAVVVVTAFATFQTAVDALHLGALDYLPKPFTPEQVRQVFARVMRIRQAAAQGESPKVAGPGGVEVGSHATLDELEAEHIRRVLASAASLEEAADVLGIDPSTLYRKRKRFGL
jgi:DNA-binding NtrC family response regulator